VVSARYFCDVLTIQGRDRVILCAMVRRRAQQVLTSTGFKSKTC
jgi:hypothetical protein